MAGLTKTEGGVPYPAGCFLDRPEPNKPSSWGLRIYELVDGKYQVTQNQLGRAAAALNSKGFMGKRRLSHSVGKSHSQLKKDLLFEYRQMGVPERSIPSYLLPPSQLVHSKRQNGRELSPATAILEHYGIKGMKWGIRKRGRTSGQKLTAKSKGMSTDELKEATKRMQLEQQYTALVSKENKANQTRLSGGKQRVEKAMKEAGQEQMKNLFSTAIGVGVEAGVSYGAEKAQPPLDRVFAALEKK
jgi:rRNA maturation endonuclease Nob1